MYSGASYIVKCSKVKPINILPTNRVLEARMALKLDDLISKKKEVAQVLDLSKSTANTHEDFKKLIEKVPEFRIKPEKVKPEDIKQLEKDKSGKKIRRKIKQDNSYQFANPIPEEMRSVKLSDLCPVNIQWNMLTTLRPKNKLDTEYFSRKRNSCHKNVLKHDRLVELGKLELATQEKERKISDEQFKRKMKNRAGVVETRYISCNECGDDFCQKETCCMFQYENFRRETNQEVLVKKEESKRGRSLTKTNKLQKSRSKSSKKKRKSSNDTGRKVAEKTKSKSKSRSRSRSKSKAKANEIAPKPKLASKFPEKPKDNKKNKKAIKKSTKK